MKIAIIGSLDFTNEIKKTADELEKAGHKTVIPYGSRLILSGKMTLKEIKAAGSTQKSKTDVIRYYYKEIQKSDAVLAMNYEKKNIPNYIGGNTFLEIGFAHVLNKKIFLFNPIPNIEFYKTEIEATEPIVINKDVSLIK